MTNATLANFSRKVKQLLLAHRKLQHRHQEVQQALASVTQERDALKAKHEEVNMRLQSLIIRLTDIEGTES